MGLKYWVFYFLMLSHNYLKAQGVAVNNTASPPDASAMLDINSNSKGILIPRLTTAQQNQLVNPATALLIFNVDAMQFQVNTGTPAQPTWQNIVTISQKDPDTYFWKTGGNSGLPGNAFIGNADDKPLMFKTSNTLRLYIDSVSGKIGIGTSSPRSSLDITGTDALVVPVGTTAERPFQPVVGMIRFNQSTGKLEGYTTTGWVALH